MTLNFNDIMRMVEKLNLYNPDLNLSKLQRAAMKVTRADELMMETHSRVRSLAGLAAAGAVAGHHRRFPAASRRGRVPMPALAARPRGLGCGSAMCCPGCAAEPNLRVCV